MNQTYEVLSETVEKKIQTYEIYEPSFPINEVFFSLKEIASLIYDQRYEDEEENDS